MVKMISIALPLSLITFILIFLVSITCCSQEDRSIYLVLLEGDAVAFHGASQNDDSPMVHLTRLQYNINYKLNLYSLRTKKN
jgi:hypothetical protein